MAGTTNVIDHFVATIFMERFTDSTGDIIEYGVPSCALPLTRSARTLAFHRIQNALRIVDLIDRRRTFRAVPPTAGRMRWIPFKLADLQCLFVNVSQKPASGFTVETCSWNKEVMLFDFAGPGRGFVLHPIVPLLGRGVR